MDQNYTYKRTNNPTPVYGENSPSVRALQTELVRKGAKIPITGNYGPLTQKAIDDMNHADVVKSALAAHPAMASYADTPGALDAIINGYQTGDWTGVAAVTGKPFNDQVATQALNDSMAVLDPAYAQEKAKDTADVQASLGLKQREYQRYLDSSAANFQSDKNTADTEAAKNGVLFSSGRVENLNNLKNKYATDQASKLDTTSTDIGNTARDYQYKYGNDAGNNLSSYYSLGGQNYNPNVASGGVTPNGLSSVYTPSSNNFYGTNRAKQSSEAKVRAAGLLYNRGNKLVSENYKNQY
ncbi:MAG: hypothetical protein V4509_00685 [Patescibacteria group bacterium]